jgi:hypothetical protein
LVFSKVRVWKILVWVKKLDFCLFVCFYPHKQTVGRNMTQCLIAWFRNWALYLAFTWIYGTGILSEHQKIVKIKDGIKNLNSNCVNAPFIYICSNVKRTVWISSRAFIIVLNFFFNNQEGTSTSLWIHSKISVTKRVWFFFLYSDSFPLFQ